MTKLFNIISGLLFSVVDGFGLLFPSIFADFDEISFFTLDAKVEIRALSRFSIGIGYLIVHLIITNLVRR